MRLGTRATLLLERRWASQHSIQAAAVSSCEVCTGGLNTVAASVIGVPIMVCSKFHAPILCACAVTAVAGTIAWPGEARAALLVNVGGSYYNVTTFTGSYDDNSSRFTTAEMPWWGDSTLAGQFATAVGSELGFPNRTPACGSAPGCYSPLHAYGVGSGVNGSWTHSTNGVVSAGVFRNESLTYAVATPAAAPAPSAVPGPLPLFGAAAAFGMSRRLRSRIAGTSASHGTSASP